MNPGTRSQSAFAKGAQTAQAPGGAGANDASHRRTQSAWENVRAPGLGRSNTTRTPRKNGFDPATPGADEPAVTGTAGYFTHRREPQPSPLSDEVPISNSKQRASPDRSQSPGRGPFGRRSAEYMSFAAEDRSRLRTPYNSTPGEKTYVTNESIRRSASTRDTTYRPSAKSGAQLNQQTPERRETRHRSASPSPKMPMSSETPRPHPLRASPEDHDSSMSSGNYGTSSSQSPAFDLYTSSEESEEEDDDTSTDETEQSRGESSKQWKDSSIHTIPSKDDAVDKPNRPKAVPSSIWKMRDGRKPSDDIRTEKSGVKDRQAGTVGPGENDENKFRFSPNEWNGAFTSGNDIFMNQSTGVQNGPTRKGGTIRPRSTRTRSSSQSAISTQRRNQSNTGKKASANDINEPRVAPSVPSIPQQNKTTINSNAPILPGTGSTHPAKLHPKPDLVPLPGEVKFSASQWAQTLKEPNWVLPPQRSSSPEKRSKTVRSKNNSNRFASMPAPKQASVSGVVDGSESSKRFESGRPSLAGSSHGGEEEDRLNDSTAAGAAGDLIDDENAMDIDIEPSMPPPPPPLSQTRPIKSQLGRTVKPFSDINHSTSTETAAAAPSVVQPQTAAAESSPLQPPLTNPTSRHGISSNGNNISTKATGTSDPQPNSLNLGVFERVVPFQHPPNTGLSDLDPVARTLPFDSHASIISPLKNDSPLLQTHHLPPTPRPPVPPVTLPPSSLASSTTTSTSRTRTTTSAAAAAAGSSSSRLTQSSWTAYLTGMQNYLVAWNAFNRTMLSHFSARQSAIDHHMQTGWLGAAGEPSDKEKMGFDGYMRALREDEMVRAHWNSSCERHREALERHGRLRDRVRRGGVRIDR